MYLKKGLGFKYLSNQEQRVYNLILNSISAMDSSIDCSQINYNIDFMKIIQFVLGDNPSVIYFNKTQIHIEESNLGKKIILLDVLPKKQVEKMLADINKSVNRIISAVKAVSKDEYSILINLYRFLQKNICYDNDELNASIKGICKSPVAHNVYGALLNRSAVCDGYSSALSLIAQKMGFDCMLINGQSAYSASFTNHAWNIIKIRDRFYHMDVTWDARKYSEFGEHSYSYFAIKDDEIANDHKWDKKFAPACQFDDFSYYIKNRLYINNSNQLDELITTIIRGGSDVFRIKISPSVSLPCKTGEYLSNKIMNEAIKPGQRIQMSYGWNEHTRCFFGKILA